MAHKGLVVFWMDGDKPRVCCETASGEKYVFRGGSKYEVHRAIGYEAQNLESGFTWHDAAATNEVVRQCWPDTNYKLSEVCQCHACRERRDRDAEMKAKIVAAESKLLELVKRYFKKG